jgi:ribosomal-protein-alanine N-acetyltransferase
MGNEFLIRLATPGDAEAIALESMAEIEHGLAWRWEAWRVSEAMAHPETNVVVATDGAAMLGFGIMEYRNDVAHLVLFAVRADARRQGIGSALLAWLEKVAAAAGIGHFRVEARLSNAAARAFYRKHGYVEIEVVPRMYDKTVDGIRLEKGARAQPEELEGMDELKRRYGGEYPDAVLTLGSRLALKSEKRFTRQYHSEDGKLRMLASRFEDGSATITYRELRMQWPHWSDEDKLEFVSACNGLCGQADYPDIVRFVMKHGDAIHGSGMALQAATFLGQDEAFELLAGMLRKADSPTANITQAIATTRHPDAEAVLRKHLVQLWGHPALWEDDPFNNWVAFDATCCIAHLLQLGVEPGELEDKARQVSRHACRGNRDACGTFLGPFYGWISRPDLGAQGLDLP